MDVFPTLAVEETKETSTVSDESDICEATNLKLLTKKSILSA